LRDEILADAQRQATRLIRKAQREAQELLDKATAESQQERSDKLTAARATAERKHDLTLATVPVEIGRLRAARVERELLDLQQKVRERLLARQGYAYGETLAMLASEAIARMEGNEFVLGLTAEDLPVFGATLPEAVRSRLTRGEIKVSVASQPAQIAAGVVVQDPAGRQVWNNSLEVRLQRMWPLLRSKIAEHAGLSSNQESAGEDL
jgi:vacuolar-type H+-ATPase subunit E/Vma4